MLSKEYRLNKNFIPAIAKKGQRLSGKYFDIKILASDSNANSKFVFIVSKKVHKSSVKRNRIKRLLRAAVFDLIKLDYFTNANYMFFVKDSALAEMKKKDVQLEIQKTIN